MLRVGTDCSGMDTPIYALEKLIINYSHEWACDIDKFARQTILANYQPKNIYTDMTTRDVNDLPDIDLYVCGFPCQSFSIAGKRSGFSDARGQIFFYCLDVIKNKQPKYFILENVKGLYNHDKGNTWSVIHNELIKLNYNIHHGLLNAKNYGCPQSRDRIYIVGTRKDLNTTFKFPDAIKLDNNALSNIVDWTDTNKRDPWNSVREHVKSIKAKDSFFDQSLVKLHTSVNKQVSPCLLASGCIYNGFVGRNANITELLRLQGFNDDFKVVVSKTQISKQLGNAMNVNVLVHLLKSLLVDD